MKDSVVDSAGGSFCWNYATDAFDGNYAGDNISCFYAGFEVVLPVTVMFLETCFLGNFLHKNIIFIIYIIGT